MTTATPAIALPKLLSTANILAGQSKPTNELVKRPGGAKLLADVLAQRLSSISDDVGKALLPDAATPQGCQNCDEAGLKTWTGRYALAILQQLQLHEEIEAEKRSTASAVAGTSKSAQQPPPPLFGIRDMKTIQILASLVARWSLASLLDQGILPSEMQERVPALQVIEQDDVQRTEELKATAQACSAILLWTSPLATQGEVRSAVLPHLLLPTVAALLQLESAGSNISASPATVLHS